MKKLFQHSEDNHFHISVGAILEKDGKILTHHVFKKDMPEKWQPLLGGLGEAYTLMRESLENNESLEAAVTRGLAEEFGAKGEIIRFLGTVVAELPFAGGFEKTTLYFQVRCTELGERPKDDDESFTTLEWLTPVELLSYLQKQAALTDTPPDLQEAKIVEAFIKANV